MLTNKTDEASAIRVQIPLGIIGLILLSMNSLILPQIEQAYGLFLPHEHASLQNAFEPIGWFFILLSICWHFFTKYLAGNPLSQTLTILLAVASLYFGNKVTASENAPVDLSRENTPNTFIESYFTRSPM